MQAAMRLCRWLLCWVCAWLPWTANAHTSRTPFDPSGVAFQGPHRNVLRRQPVPLTHRHVPNPPHNRVGLSRSLRMMAPPVPGKLLVLGGTGTVGRIIVKNAIDRGYDVRCILRSPRKGSILSDWGAEIVYGDLSLPETLPGALAGVTAVIDASATRAIELEAQRKIDWEGKYALVAACEAAQVKRLVFFSVTDAERFLDVARVKYKYVMENVIQDSDVPYTILRVPGFYSGVVSEFIRPMQLGEPVYLPPEGQGDEGVPYIAEEDAGRLALRALELPGAENKILDLVGPQPLTTEQILSLCKTLMGSRGESAQVNRVSPGLLRLSKNVSRFFYWGMSFANQVEFSGAKRFDKSPVPACDVLHVPSSSLESLTSYLQKAVGRATEGPKITVI
ncbi:unnamed protein product [Vitrella brassicaformis CCMP3155]|uniref:NAD(P)-binding domain-containing protein n=1 Tax=Vitrella brassicaformis (strain CCMP3155) TaxID=1169540 RepID=A0A0G4FWS9_VITBC|nr:unnamed protein product [Vitrella brassicaformis CCMP3155]|eukprot:CEM19685.1 unnamed protein product [Vitrella brassicaformis CCMP3155]